MSDPVETYEANAEAFYRETRFMAPGKDRPAAMGGYDADMVLMQLWRTWLELKEIRASLAAAESERDKYRADLKDAHRVIDAVCAWQGGDGEVCDVLIALDNYLEDKETP